MIKWLDDEIHCILFSFFIFTFNNNDVNDDYTILLESDCIIFIQKTF